MEGEVKRKMEWRRDGGCREIASKKEEVGIEKCKS